MVGGKLTAVIEIGVDATGIKYEHPHLSYLEIEKLLRAAQEPWQGALTQLKLAEVQCNAGSDPIGSVTDNAKVKFYGCLPCYDSEDIVGLWGVEVRGSLSMIRRLQAEFPEHFVRLVH